VSEHRLARFLMAMGDVVGNPPRLAHDPLRGLRAGEPTAVVLGDLTQVRPLGQESIAVVVGTSDPHDVTLRSRHARAHWHLPAPGPKTAAAKVASLRRLGQLIRAARLGHKVPLFYGTDRQLELLYRHRQKLGEVFLFLINDDAREVRASPIATAPKLYDTFAWRDPWPYVHWLGARWVPS
jgi:hypothetical protein